MVKRIEWTPELVGRFWSGVAKTKLDDLSFSRLAGYHLIEVVKPFLKPGGRHLDFGAGAGDLVRHLLLQGYATAAYEPYGSRLAKLPEDVEALPEYLGAIGPDSDQVFDVVLMIEVLEHVLEPELDRTLKRLNSFLPPHGTLILSVPNNEDLESGMAYCPVTDTLYHRWQHQRSFSPDTLCAFLLEYGFAPKVIHQLDLSDWTMELQMFEDLPWQALVSRLRRRLLNHYRKRFAAGESVVLGARSTIVYIGEKAADVSRDSGIRTDS